jgi:hypothetical protein
VNAPMVCTVEEHERWKAVPAWWRDQKFVGYQVIDGKPMLDLRNCRICDSTLGRWCEGEELNMDAPEGFWVRAQGYALLALEMEEGGHLDLASYFFGRAQGACEARFEESCAAAAPLVGVDEVDETLEVTEVLPVPRDYADCYADWQEAIHARAEAEAGR